MALWGTGYEVGRAFIEIEHRHKMLERYWTKPGQTQQQIKVAVTEAMRGGFTVHVTQVRENRAYFDSRRVDVPWDNKDLELSWEHLNSKLKPGQKETWTLVVKPRSTGAEGSAKASERLAAEMVATLYDESLDAFSPHNWPQGFNIFKTSSRICRSNSSTCSVAGGRAMNLCRFLTVRFHPTWWPIFGAMLTLGAGVEGRSDGKD
jgi:hypothetical protein